MAAGGRLASGASGAKALGKERLIAALKALRHPKPSFLATETTASFDQVFSDGICRLQSSTMIVIVMGVVGAGKTTVGRLLAEQFGWEFADADDFHPAANVEKIRRGVALSDDDRRPWLERLRAAIAKWIAKKHNIVLACSALKRSYREELQVGPEVRFVYLKGSADLIAQRLRLRQGHFANEQILASQFADLEEPEEAVTVEIGPAPQQIVAEIRQKLGLA
jgi:gluconokinase